MSIWWSRYERKKPNFIETDCLYCVELNNEIEKLKIENRNLKDEIYKNKTVIHKLNVILDTVVQMCERHIIK